MTAALVPVDTRLVIGPNASLGDREALLFFASLCGVSLAIAGGFAWRGYWPILPFAGLELVAVGAALAVVLRRNRYREVVAFEGGRLTIEFGALGRGVRERVQWPRGLTRVWLEQGPHATSPTRLVVGCGDERLTLGRCLTDAERERLARRLRELIHPAWVAAAEDRRD